MAELHLKPAREGDIIRDPASGRIMPPEGETKPRNPHWLRRLGRGEVAETTAEAIAKGKKEREAKEAEDRAEAEAAATEGGSSNNGGSAAAETEQATAEPVAEPAPEAKPRKGKE